MRLTLVISSMGAGGAQKVMATLANHWADKGWQVTILTLDDGASPPFFPLQAKIRHLSLGLYAESLGWTQKIFNNLRRLLLLRRAIAESRGQVVVCFMDRTNVLVLLASRLLAMPVIVSERVYPADRIGWIWEKLRSWLYPRAARIVLLNERTSAAFPKAWQEKIVVIPNPVIVSAPPPPFEHGAVCDEAVFTIVAAGRLTEQKGFDLLVEAFTRLAGEFPAWNLLILGDGHQRSTLESLCVRLGIAERVTFTGNVPQPEMYLREADLFVLPSRFEGFPNALCEAMACGLPVIAADCPTGPREIIRPGVDGLMVPSENTDALAKAMARLMKDGSLRRELGRRAVEIVDRFSLTEIDQCWERLFAEVLSEP